MEQYSELEDWVARYVERYKLNGHEISKPYDLKEDWNKTYPFVDRPGVYAIYDKNWTLAYLGKASQSNDLGSRVGSYFRYGVNRECVTAPGHKWGKHEPRFVIAVAVEKPWEAPSLEEYLIYKLKPKLNQKGINP